LRRNILRSCRNWWNQSTFTLVLTGRKILPSRHFLQTHKVRSMSEDSSFLRFIRRIRAGDSQATTDLVKRYEPEIRREVRLRLRDPRLRRDFDSLDISQSVLASFFVRAALGQYELNQPEQLLRLLVTMTRNKLIYQVRRQRRQRRDNRLIDEYGQEKLQTVAAGSSPSELVAREELLQKFRAHLTAEERQIADLRAQGHEWNEVVAQMGGTPEGRRKQLSRAVDRVAELMGLDEGGHE
jgi:DNA-directed RNA polymerase specialized sigma24 family protein